MTDDFEDSLREGLGKAVPPPPSAPDRAAGARAYAGRVRRVKATVGIGAAVVAAAAIVVPTVLASPPHGTSPSASSRHPLVIPPHAHSFTCADTSQDSWMKTTPPSGVVARGALLARLCPADTESGFWTAPADPLVTHVDELVDDLNAQPKMTLGSCPGSPSAHSYTLTFQYPDGHISSIFGTWDLCPYISAGSVTRSGASTVLQSYLDLLRDQRAHDAPPFEVAHPAACLPGSRESDLASLLVDHRSLDLSALRTCNYSLGAWTLSGTLSSALALQISADLAAHATHQQPPLSTIRTCEAERGPRESLLISGIDRWGDHIELAADDCERFFTFIDSAGTWYWTPTAQAWALLNSPHQTTLPPIGELKGRLLLVGGPAGTPPRATVGTINLIRGDLVVSPIVTRDDGTFARFLAPGRYHVSGTSPSYDGGRSPCRPVHPNVFVRAHQTVHVDVLCQEK